MQICEISEATFLEGIRTNYKHTFWHERAAFQWSAFGRSTAGNDVVATKNNIIYFIFFPVVYFSQGVLGSKNLFSESCLERPKT